MKVTNIEKWFIVNHSFKQDINDFENAIDRIQAKLITVGKTLQPIAVIIGEDVDHISDSYVTIDQHHFAVESPLPAVDVCFILVILCNVKLCGCFLKKPFVS